MLATLFNYLFYSSLILPSNETICKGNSICPIVWETPMHGHIEIQMDDNNTWSSTTDIGKSFLSVIVDESSTTYEWDVPQYITQFWEQPKRVVLADLESGEHYYSENFTITGITLETDISGPLNSQTTLPITWSSNDNSQSFGVYMMQDNSIIETIEDTILPANYTYYWNVPYKPNIDFSLLIRSSDNKTFVRSGNFQILTTTTLLTTTTPIITPTTEIIPTTDISDAIIALIIIISLIIILCLAIYLYAKCCLNDDYVGCGVSTRVHPQPITRNNVSNPVYENRTKHHNVDICMPVPPRQLPPLPRNQRIITNEIYDSQPVYAKLNLQGTKFKSIDPANIINYNHLSQSTRGMI